MPLQDIVPPVVSVCREGTVSELYYSLPDGQRLDDDSFRRLAVLMLQAALRAPLTLGRTFACLTPSAGFAVIPGSEAEHLRAQVRDLIVNAITNRRSPT